MSENFVFTKSSEETAMLFGAFDENARTVENEFCVRLENVHGAPDGGDAVRIVGEEADVSAARRVLELLLKTAAAGDFIPRQTVDYVISLVKGGTDGEESDYSEGSLCLTYRAKPIRAKTAGQKAYAAMIAKTPLTFGIGPAGTGKTFLAVAMAAEALKNKSVDRIILTRPAVEAGERLGFLPGDLQTKIDPYLRPLYDALYEMMGPENCQKHMERGTIEIAPLAYMRGRTLDNSFIILDEAQNTTQEQMKMFLTRLGYNSRAVVTGDLTQTDLPGGQVSGLSVATKILDGVEGVGIHRFTVRDVVRHPLVRRIIDAYEKFEKEKNNRK